MPRATPSSLRCMKAARCRRPMRQRVRSTAHSTSSECWQHTSRAARLAMSAPPWNGKRPRDHQRRGRRSLHHVPLAVPMLVLRLGVALVFWRSGLTKLPFGNLSTLALFEEEYRVPLLPPETAAYLATAIEIVVPWLLLLGLGTRLGAAI